MAKNSNTDSEQDDSYAVVKRVLAENGRDYFLHYLLAFAMLALQAATTAIPAYLVANIVNDVFVKQDMDKAIWISLAIFFAFTIRGFASYGSQLILARIGNNIVARYQRKVFDHLLHLGVEFFKDTRSAYLVGQINQNIGGMRNLLNQFVVVFARDLFSLVALVSVMIYQDPTMSLATVTVLPVLFFIISRYVRRIRKVARSEVDLNSRVTSAIVETSQGIEIVKSFTMEQQLREKMHELTAAAENRSNLIAKLNAKTKPPTEILAGFAIAAVVAFGGWRVAELGDDAGKLFSFLTAAMLAYEPARKLASFRVTFEKSLVNARMLYELLDTPPRQADKPNASELSIINGKIELEDIHFTYKENGQIGKDAPITINGVSFIAEQNQTTALVGPSGGGKSTLINLIQRFFDLDGGAILVDGQNICDVTGSSLRQHISYVSQQPIMFEGTIMDNIRYGAPNASDEEVIQAAKLAQAHNFISEFSEGYDTSVGEMGSNLSGGQRQRISIARAIVRNAPILLLDEATSALDNESEKAVQRALEELMKGRTTIVIAHRLSTIKHADKIVVINQGQLVEEGTHDHLIADEDGLYAKLYQIIDSQNLEVEVTEASKA